MSLSEGDAALALARERDLWEAYVTRNRDRIETLVDPLALDVGPSGARDRDEVLAMLDDLRVDRYSIEDLVVREVGSTSVATYRATVEGSYRGSPFRHATVIATSVWVHDRGAWRLVHRTETPIQAKL